MKKPDPEELAKQLKNIGPVMAGKLIDAGIDSPEKLSRLGAKESYLRIHRCGGFCGKFNAAYLYALEGAILDVDWLAIPRATRNEYKQFTQMLRDGKINP